MQRTIRSSTFETNSSSSHSITIDNSYHGKTSAKDVNIECGEFGWEYVRFNDFATKASYFWTLACGYTDHPLCHRMERLAVKYEFDLIYPKKDAYHYVDHGTEHYSGWVVERPELDTDEGLMDFMVSTSGWIMLGNDNEQGEPNFRLTPNQVNDSPYHLILNEDPNLSYAIPDCLQTTIYEYACDATYEHLDKGRGWDEGHTRIVTVEDGLIHAVTEKYDYKGKKYDVLKEHTLHYTIKSK